ncbi:alpha/beta hydrolase [Sharpea azabuensis]|uniref:Serine aminopeptidase S33 domain-containing protein n=1 Tax=Sharpea azabuensis TaxID=322505 RepID=A0A1H6SYR9_9FIRM|nr:alpha/beta fold hydrolase [Sharpea azabuensis]SEI69160.1 hypothetical protein SAMN04487834_10179 [Sharpea azabuensis]
MKKFFLLILTALVILAGFYGYDYYHQPEKEKLPVIVKNPQKREHDEIKDVYVNIRNEHIYGQVFIPASSQGTLPLLILCHGFGGHYTDLIPIARKCMANGIAAFCFDFRGGAPTNKSDGKMVDMSIKTEEEDLEAVIETMRHLDFVDNDRIYLGGHSQGGLVASLVGAKREDIQGLFLAAPAFNIPRLFRFVPVPKEGKTYHFLNADVGRKYVEDARSIKIYDDVKSFDKTVLIFHGGSDTLVPIQYSAEAVEEYKHARLISYEDADHLFNEHYLNDMADQIIATIKK